MRKTWSAYPYIFWIIIFTVVPLALVLYFSFTVKTPAGIQFTLDNFRRFSEPIYLKVLMRSITLAAISTVLCLLLGYPAAYILAKNKLKNKNALIMLLVLPMWMNFLLRTYAWLTLLERKGLINTILAHLGLPQLNLLYNEFAVVLGMVYNFIPFMILPIYTVLSKIDNSLLEAAEDLGSDPWHTFRRVVFPLSLPGVWSGITMVFMPAVTTFVIPRLLGGGQYTLIGNLIEQQFLTVGDWNFGSAISTVMIVIILLGMGFTSRYEKEQEGGGGLW
ncbi:MAG TPA: ABC transporter permease [Firmicutes bacterium]|jgi:spermidine/putrescine transport system permease protein|nr:ABC transporter permease [Bacillota bacterium]HOQ24264.1 ABC transporter permease [Bacillota bacterium]HPT66472.1 ABC transporter permease [Bacillota bacterium]